MPRAASARSRPDSRAAASRRRRATRHQAVHFALDLPESSRLHPFARIDYDLPSRIQPVKPAPEHFAQPALDAIAHHGAADSARDGETNPGAGAHGLLRLQQEGRKEWSGEPGAVLINVAKIPGFENASVFGEAGDSLPLVAYSQLVPAASPPPGQNRPAILCLHAHPETVGLRALPVVRLIRTFWHLCSLEPAQTRLSCPVSASYSNPFSIEYRGAPGNRASASGGRRNIRVL